MQRRLNRFARSIQEGPASPGLLRSEEKGQQVADVKARQINRNPLAPPGETDLTHVAEDETAATEFHCGHGLADLQNTARERRNVFNAMMEAVKTYSLGQIGHALPWVGSTKGICGRTVLLNYLPPQV